MTAYIPRTLSYFDLEGKECKVAEAELATRDGPVVILGDPGMGKTELLKTLGHLKGFRYLTARKFTREVNPATLTTSGDVLVIDALDEVASATESDPINQVLAQLGKCGFPRFFLSCRGADWQGAIGRQDIDEEYSQDPLVLTLLPVSRKEALDHLTLVLGDIRAKSVLSDLDAKSLQALYGNPLMLSLIGKVVLRDGQLPPTRHDLYAKSCELLYQEANDRHAKSRLASLPMTTVLDAAGAACAALLLTGSEAISCEAPAKVLDGDLPVAELAELSGGSDLRTVLKSKLFMRLADGDRFGPLHRTIAEFLGARWLAGRASAVSSTRLLSLIAHNGGPPASLRGLHAWLADFDQELARHVVSTDPYGVLKYADPTQLSDSGVRLLLQALLRLSIEDPHFRSGDWSQQIADGLARQTLVPDLKALIFDRATPFQLRMLLLEALEGKPVVAALAAPLQALFLQDGRRPYYFAERRAAGDALIAAHGLSLDWPKLIRSLQFRAGEDPRRLSVELAHHVGAGLFSAKQIAEISLSYLALMPGRSVVRQRVDTVGVLYFLARDMPIKMVADVLDEIVEINPNPGARRDWETRWSLSELIDTLIVRAIESSPPTPSQLLSWLRLARRRDNHAIDRSRDIMEALRANDVLRRGIQYEALIVATDHENLWNRGSRLAEIHQALYPTSADVVWLIDKAKPDPRLPDQFETLCDLVRIARSRGKLEKAVLLAVAPSAAVSTDFAAFLTEQRKNRQPEWERKEKARQRRTSKEREARWARHRVTFEEKRAEMRAGALGGIDSPAQAYLGRFYDLTNSAPPVARLEQWLGKPLARDALVGFEATLHRQDLPSAESVAENYGDSKRWRFNLPMLAGMLERARAGTGFDDLREDVVIATRITLLHEHIDEETGGKILETALAAWFAERPNSGERLVRLTIEPQLRHRRGHVSGLYQLVRGERPDPLVDMLAPEWLRAFPNMERTNEYELVGHLMRSGNWDAVAAAGASRKAAGYADQDHELSWLAIGFVMDFEGHRTELDAAASDPNFLWFIRTWRGAARREGAGERPASLSGLMWIVETFRTRFPATWRSGSSSGDTNPADATEFLMAIIRTIATDLSDAGLEAMDALRAAPNDGYSDTVRNARSQQILARREVDFTPPTLAQVMTVTAGSSPQSVTDLQAIALDALERAQKKVFGDDLESVSLFYDNNEPLGENDCRDRLAVLLRGELPFGIEVTPERAAPGHTRADLVFALGKIHLPLEAKGQWHAELWSAAQEQLDHSYIRDWRADGAGVYLVFWFGPDVVARAKLKGPPRGQKRPTTPDGLREALTARVPAHRRGSVSVVVFDVSRPSRGGSG